MNQNALVAKVAEAAGVPTGEVTVKVRPGTQIKANALWEGSCSPASPRKKVGVFLAKSGEDLAVEGAIKRMSFDVPFPETVLVLFDAKGSRHARVFGYSDSDIAARLAKLFNTEITTVRRPANSPDTPPPATLNSSELEQRLEESPNVVLQGPPGTGKTSLALELIRARLAGSEATVDECRYSRLLEEANNDPQELVKSQQTKGHALPIIWELVQLHPAYGYEDLVRRLKPDTVNGVLRFAVQDQLLPQLCRLALDRGKQKPVLLILDEINRCDLAATLGEFTFAIDPGYRGFPVRFKIPGPNVPLTTAVPNNLWIVGTMNTADRSIALLDYAVRRRFQFIEIPSSPDVVEKWYEANPQLGVLARGIFECCNEGLLRRISVGHSSFLIEPLPLETWPGRLARQVAYHVVPLLLEYVKEGLRSSSQFAYKGLNLPLSAQHTIAIELEALIRKELPTVADDHISP